MVLNQVDGEFDPSRESNYAELCCRVAKPVLATLGWQGLSFDRECDWMTILSRHVCEMLRLKPLPAISSTHRRLKLLASPGMTLAGGGHLAFNSSTINSIKKERYD